MSRKKKVSVDDISKVTKKVVERPILKCDICGKVLNYEDDPSNKIKIINTLDQAEMGYIFISFDTADIENSPITYKPAEKMCINCKKRILKEILEKL